MVPTFNFNFKYIEILPDMSEKQWWFSGCANLMPNYLNEKVSVAGAVAMLHLLLGKKFLLILQIFKLG